MRRSRRRPARIILALALGIAPSCRPSSGREAEAEPPRPVVAEPVRLGNIRGAVSATGLVEAQPGAILSVFSTQAARIAEVTKNAGDPVVSGELLVRFEVPALRAQVAANAAAVKAAEIRAQQTSLHQKRVRELVTRGAASQSEMEAADREAESAQAELTAALAAQSLAEAQTEHTEIRAPFNGTVVERHRNPGDTARPDDQEPILRVIDPRQVQVATKVSAADAARFTVGASARAIAPGRSDAELLRVATRPIPAPGAQSIDVTLSFDSPTELAPGTQVALEIDAEQRSNVPLVPLVALLRDGSGAAVMVASGDAAERRPVEVGLVDGQYVEIRSGLKPGELVVTQGHTGLRDGAAISAGIP